MVVTITIDDDVWKKLVDLKYNSNSATYSDVLRKTFKMKTKKGDNKK